MFPLVAEVLRSVVSHESETTIPMTDTEARVLTATQHGFPIATRPYEVLGERLGITEGEALGALNALRERGLVRRVGATFSPAHLGYKSTLAAAKVDDPAKVESVAEAINAFPDVTHNYLRDHAYNVWFTIIAASQERMDHVMDAVGATPGVSDTLFLPATRLFKIRVAFDVAKESGADAVREEKTDAYQQRTVEPDAVDAPEFTEHEKRMIRILQGHIDDSATPFATLAREAGVSEDELISRITAWKGSGLIRRFGAVVRHRRMGVSHNAMTVWDVPDDQAERAGIIMASFSEVSHCYERIRLPQWPANLYTMIHAKSEGGAEEVAGRIRAALADAGISVPEPELLYSSREFKKRSMRYFTEDTYAQ